MLSNRFSYSKYHLHRKFKEIAGITLNAYIRKRRIENSIYLLSANPDIDITEVAGYCGFSSATYSREFRNVFNRTPNEWRNIYKKNAADQKDSNICKNYKQFIDYSDTGIPKEIAKISIVDLQPVRISAKIYYGDYCDAKTGDVWNQVKSSNRCGGQYVLISLNSPAVTDRESCLYLLGFESDRDIPEFCNIVLDGKYAVLDYEGLRSRFREAYTWAIKYYFPQKGLKYDYRVQFHKYGMVPNRNNCDIACKIYIPVSYL
ncbi:MAG: AraC family transcriptional regulator [Eubacteriales bacterium]|nr:AraC family transcriptional regulator [Eubacteriales bacterium]